MTKISRRTLFKGAGAATLATLSSPALADEKVKVGFIFLGPIGDYGWTWAHNKGREAVDAALGDKVETVYVENVADAGLASLLATTRYSMPVALSMRLAQVVGTIGSAEISFPSVRSMT